MKVKRQVWLWVLAVVVCFAGSAAAQNSADTGRMAEFAKHWKTQLGPNINRLSGAAQNFINLNVQVEKLKTIAAALSAGKQGGGPGLSESRSQSAVPNMLGGSAKELAPGKPASTPDITDTRFSGAVQSETSTAWCGKEAVVGFNDIGSLWESNPGGAAIGLVAPTTGFSLNGYAVSTNSGSSFTDKGFPTVGPLGTEMLGDPVLACTDPTTFYYASLYLDFTGSCPSPSGFCSDVTVSTSTNGGSTFGAQAPAVQKDFFFHFLDKEWMTVNEATPSDIFVTYTDFDFSNFDSGPGNDCGAPGTDVVRTAIELVSSSNGGMTWSSPTEVAKDCSDFAFLQGSQVVVDPATGHVFVAWESFAADFSTREIDIAKSTDGGVTFSSPVKVSSVDPVGDEDAFFGLQGHIRDFDFPSLTIGKGKNAGNLYIVWNDGDNRHPDAVTAFLKLFGIGDGNYGFSDVFFSSSTDGGSTWSSPIAVNTDASKKALIDHYQPGVASDKTGKLAVCWYDRRDDTNNFLIDRFCGKSTDGVKWSNKKITTVNSPSVANQDFEIAGDYMGDYDQLTSDATNTKSGFLGGFNNTQAGNQNVHVNKF